MSLRSTSPHVRHAGELHRKRPPPAVGPVKRGLLLHQLTAGRHLRRRFHDVQVRKVPDVVQDVLARGPVQELPAPLLAVVVVLLLQPILLKSVRLGDFDRDGSAPVSDAAEG